MDCLLCHLFNCLADIPTTCHHLAALFRSERWFHILTALLLSTKWRWLATDLGRQCSMYFGKCSLQKIMTNSLQVSEHLTPCICRLIRLFVERSFYSFVASKHLSDPTQSLAHVANRDLLLSAMAQLVALVLPEILSDHDFHTRVYFVGRGHWQ